MGMLEDLRQLSDQVKRRLAHIKGEEATKQALVMPFLQVLGYDVYDPTEVQPEYIADFAKKRSNGQMEKVDIAVRLGGAPALFIECKPVGAVPEDHDGQLSRYFNATPSVKVAVVTNGTRFRFFTDLSAPNVMDATPFFEFDLTNFSERDAENVRTFSKDGFNPTAVQTCAEEIIYTDRLTRLVNDLLRNPSENFTRFLLGELDLVSGRVTARVVERFQPIVKKAVQTTLVEMMTRSIAQEISEGIAPAPPVTTPTSTSTSASLPSAPPGARTSAPSMEGLERQIVTTEEELELFEIVKRICASAPDGGSIAYKDTTAYFGINLGRSSQWFIRAFTAGKKSLVLRLPLEQVRPLAVGFEVEAAPEGIGKSRVFLTSVRDVERLSSLVLAAYDDARRNGATDDPKSSG